MVAVLLQEGAAKFFGSCNASFLNQAGDSLEFRWEADKIVGLCYCKFCLRFMTCGTVQLPKHAPAWGESAIVRHGGLIGGKCIFRSV